MSDFFCYGGTANVSLPRYKRERCANNKRKAALLAASVRTGCSFYYRVFGNAKEKQSVRSH